MAGVAKRRMVVEGVGLPVPAAGTIPHAIIGGMREGWNETKDILKQASAATENFRSAKVVICQLVDDGYLSREREPDTIKRHVHQRYALTMGGHQVKEHIAASSCQP